MTYSECECEFTFAINLPDIIADVVPHTASDDQQSFAGVLYSGTV